MSDQILRDWIDKFEQVNESMGELAENYRFLLNNTEEYENGEINHRDFPNFEDDVNWLIYESVKFGNMYYQTQIDGVFAVNRGSAFVSLYGKEENVRKRVESDEELNYRKLEINGGMKQVQEYINNAPNNPAAQSLIESYEYWMDNYEEIKDSNMDEELINKVPLGGSKINIMFIYSVLFGMIWERLYPSIYGVMNIDNELVSLHTQKRYAKENADTDEYVQRVVITDGQANAEQIL